jgi:hypothetical protein
MASKSLFEDSSRDYAGCLTLETSLSERTRDALSNSPKHLAKMSLSVALAGRKISGCEWEPGQTRQPVDNWSGDSNGRRRVNQGS